MSLAFKLSIDLTGQVHAHSSMAHRHIIAGLLAQATNACCSNGATMSGDLTLPNPTPAGGAPYKVGRWEFTDDEGGK
jgi:hypothetical protein